MQRTPQPGHPYRALPRFPFALWFVIGLYALSHLLPVIEVFGQWMFGWQASAATVETALDLLWHGKHDWLVVFGWFPNPLLWLGVTCMLIGRRRNLCLAGIGAGLAGLAAVVCALLWLLYPEMRGDLLVGYYVWLASMALLTGVGFWTAVRTKRQFGANGT